MITSDKIPSLGPYSLAVKTPNGFVHTSGSLGLKDGALVEGIEAQTLVSLQNLEIVLKEAGCTKFDVVSVTIMLADLKDFAKVNKVYGEFFEGHKPARACTQHAAIPAGGLIEMSCIAFKE
ncbi:YjgF/YER057c/UK114 family like protein [Aduncisulcus paluster]|uniref:YjgF/YER057c/UK114 family like protein n=1 Tax=Aduncisulcus paluster TaxID=2918883 RepID=A0ABQ5KYT9_9EUKA|nr:YjgF/YER057c/UK114 family like protein [Aduncisulcus paluster]